MRKITPEQAMGSEYGKIINKHEQAKRRCGIKPRNEYRIVTHDPGFDAHGNHCKQCNEMHTAPSVYPYVLPTVPKRIGLHWAGAHNIESIIEIRNVIIETKAGKKTVFQGTCIDPESLKVHSEWRPYMKITKTGKTVAL